MLIQQETLTLAAQVHLLRLQLVEHYLDRMHKTKAKLALVSLRLLKNQPRN
jgi:hypothetical protein